MATTSEHCEAEKGMGNSGKAVSYFKINYFKKNLMNVHLKSNFIFKNSVSAHTRHSSTIYKGVNASSLLQCAKLK